MSSRLVSQGARGFVAAGTLFFVAAHVAIAAGAGRRAVVAVALYGFVFHVLFGKAYALVPSYFDRTLAAPRVPIVHLPLAVVGTASLTLGSGGPPWLRPVGTLCWTAGAALFLVTLAWTVRDTPTGAETGTGGANSHREPVDRRANAAVPVVFAYLGLAVVAMLADLAGRPLLVGPQVSHLLAAGTATLLVFAVGLRLFPRFLVARPPRALVPVVLVSGAVAPALLAGGLFDRPLLIVGGTLQAVAVVGFAVTYLALFVRSDRRRVGFYAVLVAVVAGVGGVAIGLTAVLLGRTPAFVTAHYRAMLLGFLGLTIVGATYQFYPPTVGQWPAANDRTALVSIAVLAAGLLGQIAGLLGSRTWLATGGSLLGTLGAVAYAWLVFAALARRSS